MNLLPNYENAFISIDKFTQYCLNTEHPEGKHKAYLFEKVLGITADDAEWLRTEIIENLSQYEAVEKEETAFGRKFLVEIKIRKSEKQANILTAWQIDKNSDIPRLITCYLKN
jgi:hemerythrin-like domain-containing protein